MKSFDTNLLKNKPVDSHERPLLGLSACLLSKEGHFDTGLTKNNDINKILVKLSKYIDFVSFSSDSEPDPEVAYASPKATFYLRQKNNIIQKINTKQNSTENHPVDKDVADPALRFQMKYFAQLKNLTKSKSPEFKDLDGFIFKKNSYGYCESKESVVIHKNAMYGKKGVDDFSEIFLKHDPLIPVEEASRLNDSILCENFFERVYAYRRWKVITNNENGIVNCVQDLIEFHSSHKYMLMARGSQFYQELGRMVAGTTTKDLSERSEKYIQHFMQVMKIIPLTGRQVNVLMHIMGYLKKALNAEDKQELLTAFEAYRLKKTTLKTPLTLLRHQFSVNNQKYIAKQHYLNPFPDELDIRSTY